MSNNFYKIAQRQLHSDVNSSPPTYFDTIYQEQDDTPNVEAVTRRLTALRKDTILLLQKGIQDLETIQTKYKQYLQELRKLEEQNQQLLKENLSLRKALQQAYQQIDLLMLQQSELRGKIGTQTPSLYPNLSSSVQENQSMSSITTSNNESSPRNSASLNIPFAYSPVNNLLYSRSNPPPSHRMQNSNTRIDNLERRVAELADEMLEIKKHLQQIYQILNNKTTTSNPSIGSPLQGFLNS